MHIHSTGYTDVGAGEHASQELISNKAPHTRARPIHARRPIPIRVLLVESNDDDARLFQRTLSGSDICRFKVEHLGSLGEALRYLSRGLPDMIALDLSLPDSVGMETFTAVQERADGVPILVLSEQAGKNLAMKAVLAGAQDYLLRGWADGNLVAHSIFHLVERKRAEEALQKARAEMETHVQERTIELARVNRALQVEITEREQVEKALAQSEQYYRGLFESAHDAIIILDPEGEIVLDVNDCACRIYGLSRDEFIGMSMESVSHDVSHGKLQITETLARESSYRFETIQYRSDGAKLILDVNASVVDYRGRPALLSVNRDVTERKQTEEALRRSEERARAEAVRVAALARVAARLNAQLDLDAVLSAVCEETARALDVQVATVSLYDRQLESLYLACGSGLPPGFTLQVEKLSHETYQEYVQTNGKISVVPDVQDEPGLLNATAYDAIDLRTTVGAGMVRNGVLVGKLNIGTLGRTRRFTEDELALLQGLAHQAAQAISNARLYEDAQRRIKQVQALRNIDIAITGSHDLRATLNVVLGQVREQLGVDAAAVLLLDPHTQMLSFAAGNGFRSEAIARSSVPLGVGYAGRAALQGQVLCIGDMSQVDDFHRAPLLVGEDFASYCAVPLISKGHLKGVLEVFNRSALDSHSEWLEFFEALAGQTAIAIDNATLFTDLQRSNVDLALAYDTTLQGWSRALDLRDKETEGHSQRVTDMMVRLAQALGMSEDEELAQMRRGALLHDIGKMGIPDAILLKPGPLTDQEWEIMRRHPSYAYDLLSPILFLHPALTIPYCHHEKWDGTGYPRGLKGEQIPLAARIFAVVDVWDALRSNRPYRAAWPAERVREHISSLAGTHFDPAVVDAFLKMNL
ncbi:MAG TPA: HD domain-containing phosphohydrolase [Chloroflexia bacterium]|nr:HD domain-containing phosphohydrolase [Chloroflexia bacterium]